MTSFFIQMETILMNGCESSVTLRGSNFAWFTIDEGPNSVRYMLPQERLT